METRGIKAPCFFRKKMVKKYQIAFIFILSSIQLLSQLAGVQSVKLVPSKAEKDLYEINTIVFKGNTFFPEEELIGTISSKATNRSLPHKGLQFYLDALRANRASPKDLKVSLAKSVKDLWNEVRYYDRLKAEEDVKTITFLYFQHGYHKAEISYKFEAMEDKTGNVLTFYINQNERWNIKSLIYQGLEGLPTDIQDEINLKIRKITPDSAFNEFQITDEAEQIKKYLLNSGYYFANFDEPIVTVDTLLIYDSVSVKFNTGKRYRIGEINFIDSTKGQRLVVNKTKSTLVDLIPGEWYKQTNMENTYNNLLSLGTFDMVTIDTAFSKTNQDMVIPFTIFTQYRKQQEYGLALFTNQTVYNNAFNIGIEFSYFHRNFFGAAQVINPFVRLVAEDINRSIQTGSKLELEYQLGLNYSQALFLTTKNTKIGFSTQAMISQRVLYNRLKIFTFSLPVKFPVTLPKWTYFNHMSLDFSFERQVPNRFQEVKAEMEKEAQTYEDKLRVQEAISVYTNLDRFVHNENPVLTSNLIGVSLIGDSRDNPFSPSNGKYSFLSIDGTNPLFLAFPKISGIAKYAKIQLSNLWFWSVSPQAIIALKQREGFIYWFDKANSFVPYERQFFAGGANSVRGWPSRQLRYNIYKDFLDKNSIAYEFARDFTGNAGLIEGSLELRYSFGKPGYIKGFLADLISSMGITTFLDWGNAYQWFLTDSAGNYPYSYKWLDIIKGIAVSYGLGLRYNTPVGPFRIDIAWPIYDPNQEKKPFSHLQFNIGLGHSF